MGGPSVYACVCHVMFECSLRHINMTEQLENDKSMLCKGSLMRMHIKDVCYYHYLLLLMEQAMRKAYYILYRAMLCLQTNFNQG